MNYRIALVVRTDSLDYDDRIRKEMLTVQKLYPNIKFKIFAFLDENKDYEGVSSYGIPLRSIRLKSREKYKTNQGHFYKAIESYTAIRNKLKGFDAVWCADNQVFMVAALVKTPRLLWDLHELPDFFETNWVKRMFLKYIFGRCKVIIHANPQRKDYLIRTGLITEPLKHYSIRNFPNFDDIDTNYDDKYYDFVKWKADRNCVYLQGLYGDERAAEESIDAILEENMCAVVIGRFDQKTLSSLQNKWGDKLYSNIYFTGKVPQLKIPQYVAQCITTFVFYKYINNNNIYCEANRFYQAVLLGIPVIVGKNPPMKDLVEKYQFGIVINDDGSKVELIREALKKILLKYDFYKKNAINNRHQILWENQNNDIRAIINKLFEDK